VAASFADAVMTLRLPELASADELMRGLGDRTQAPLDSMDADRRAALIAQLVRQLRGLSVQTANSVEQRLLAKLEAGPPVERELPLGDSLALISLRNSVRHLLVFRRVDFAESMRMQSAVANVARVVVGHGYSRVRIISDAIGHTVIFEGAANVDLERASGVGDALRSAEDAGYRVRKEARIELRYTFRS
jgi:hypothetical protein